MYSYTAYTPEVPDVLLHHQVAMYRVEAPAEQVDGEVIPRALLAGSPEGGHAFAALQRGIECAFVSIRRTWFIDRLKFESHFVLAVNIPCDEDGTFNETYLSGCASAMRKRHAPEKPAPSFRPTRWLAISLGYGSRLC